MMIGRIIFKVAQNFIIFNEETQEKIVAQIRKKTKSEYTILVGDFVEYSKIDNSFVIEKILKRKNTLIRPKIANVDYIILVYSFKEPDYNSFLLNKYLAYYESRNIENIIIYFSKTDLCTKEEDIFKFESVNSEYQNDGYIVYSNKNKEFFKNNIHNILKNKVLCFAGQSGSGKSTLINFLLPELKLKTQEISSSLNRGKHTTTSTLMFPYFGGFIVDTPGFSSLELDMSLEEMGSCYNDFRNNRVNCKFSNCIHKNEKDCQIKKMVNEKKISLNRYNDYLKLIDAKIKLK